MRSALAILTLTTSLSVTALAQQPQDIVLLPSIGANNALVLRVFNNTKVPRSIEHGHVSLGGTVDRPACEAKLPPTALEPGGMRSIEIAGSGDLSRCLGVPAAVTTRHNGLSVQMTVPTDAPSASPTEKGMLHVVLGIKRGEQVTETTYHAAIR